MPVPAWFAELLPSLTPSQLEQLHGHYELLDRWNQRMSLTSVAPGPEMALRHYAESVFFAEHVPDAYEGMTIADIGSGAGFPGIPMAIMRPGWRVTLVESNQRKAVFLRESARGLDNVTVVSTRAEQLAGSYDWIVSRAVDPQEVVKLVPKLATRIGLMLGQDDFFSLKGHAHIAWRDPVQLPWGNRRICAYGFHVEHS